MAAPLAAARGVPASPSPGAKASPAAVPGAAAAAVASNAGCSGSGEAGFEKGRPNDGGASGSAARNARVGLPHRSALKLRRCGPAKGQSEGSPGR